jgi:hypothetical protein
VQMNRLQTHQLVNAALLIVYFTNMWNGGIEGKQYAFLFICLYNDVFSNAYVIYLQLGMKGLNSLQTRFNACLVDSIRG